MDLLYARYIFDRDFNALSFSFVCNDAPQLGGPIFHYHVDVRRP